MRIPIIITYYKNLSILLHCLSNLKETLEKTEIETEVLIINDNPSEKLENNISIKNILQDCIIIDCDINRGYAGACNFAVERIDSELFVLLDSDIMVTDGWIKNMYNTITSHPNAGAVSSIILNMEDNTVLHMGFGTYKIDMIKPFVFRPINQIPASILKSDFVSPTLTSGCCLINKQAYLQVGGMDSQLYNGYCDLDLFYKFDEQNYENYVCSKSFVFHRGCVSGEVRNRKKQDTKALFCSKWGQKNIKEGLEMLKSLYQYNTISLTNSKYILFDFCQSLFSSEYIEQIIESIFDIEYTYKINISGTSKIILEDYISLSLQRSKFDFIYFCDCYKDLTDNYHWFTSRYGYNDKIIDRNGNIIDLK